MTDKLKPCPFCGGEANLLKRKFKTGFYPSGGTYYVHCKTCLITTQPRKKRKMLSNFGTGGQTMTNRDRLIELLHKAEDICDSTLDCDTCKYVLSGSCKTVLIADYLLANGVTLSPLPIGSTVYEIRAKGVREYGKHRKYDYSPDTAFSLNNAIKQKAILYIAPKKFCKSDKARLNKTVFLTKEEAEAELRKRCEDNA